MAGGGFGTGWGAVGWGGVLPVGGLNINETVPVGESVAVWLPLWVKAIVPSSPFVVTVEFSHPLDPSYAPNFQATSYSIPSLTVTGAAPGANPYNVRVHTAEQAATVYTLTVNDAQSNLGDAIDPNRDSGIFAGFPVSPTFFATGQSRSKIMLTFATEILLTAAVTDPASYTITDFAGNSYTVDSATLNGPAGDPPIWVTLELGTDLDPGGYYVCTISSSITAANGLAFFPRTDVFQYIERDYTGQAACSIPIATFSGEVEPLAYPEPNNLFQYPEQFDNPYWVKQSGTIVPNATNGPPSYTRELTATADEFFEDSTLSEHQPGRVASPTRGGRYTFSIFAKRSNRHWLLFTLSDMPGGGTQAVYFDVKNGVAGSSTFDPSANAAWGVDELDDGWYRCWLHITLISDERQFTLMVAEDDLVHSYQGLDQSALYLFGAQCVVTSLLGEPLGQIFFSPALDTSVPADSTIQVDSVSVCTRAYDVYEFPTLPDPHPLTTFGATWHNGSVLNDADSVLQATAERLGQAQIILSDHPQDTWSGAADGPADATLQETFDQTKVALLNVDETAGWVLFDGVGTPFICADNLAPIGPGATTNINLQP